MAKHNAHDKMVLVRHDPGQKRKNTIRSIFLILVCSSIAYYVGIFEMNVRHDSALDRLAQLSELQKNIMAQNTALQQKVTNLEQSEAINKRAKQEIQTTIGAMQDRIAQLQKDVTFYQSIMAPSKNNKGLQIQSVELSPLSEKSRYAYKIILAQVAENRRYVEGVVAVNLIGKQGAEDIVLPLRDVSTVKELGIKFRFRYFQEFEGELLLPEGFKPEQLQVVAQSKGKKASRIESDIEWAQLVPDRTGTTAEVTASAEQ